MAHVAWLSSLQIFLLSRAPPDLGSAQSGSVFYTIVNCQPNGGLRWIRPFDAVAAMSRDVQIVAWLEVDYLVRISEAQVSFPREHDYPFVQILIQPFAVGRALPGGDDSLQPKSLRVQERFREFLVLELSDAVENIPEYIHCV